jgi:hypothetical protein
MEASTAKREGPIFEHTEDSSSISEGDRMPKGTEDESIPDEVL